MMAKVKNENKILLKFFALMFVLGMMVFNWGSISWLFNYTAFSRYVSDVFEKESEQIAIAETEADVVFEQRQTDVNTATTEETTIIQNPVRSNSLEVPGLGLAVPLIFDRSMTDDDVYKALDRGVVHYPTSVLPGQEGQTLLLGHSAPPGWPKIKYDWVFSKLDTLQTGDRVFVYFNNKKYEYAVSGNLLVERGGQIPQNPTNSPNTLILITCWPPGKDYLWRLLVVAELVQVY